MFTFKKRYCVSYAMLLMLRINLVHILKLKKVILIKSLAPNFQYRCDVEEALSEIYKLISKKKNKKKVYKKANTFNSDKLKETRKLNQLK